MQVLRTLAAYWRLIAASAAVGLGLALAAAFIMRPVYRSETLLAFNDEKMSGTDLSGLTSQFSGLAALAGVSLGGAEGQRDIAVALLTSRDFLESFINDHQLLPVLFAGRWDARNRRWRHPDDPPTLSDGVKRLRRDVLSVTEDRRTHLIRVAVEWRDRQAGAEWANELVSRANAVTRRWAIEDARSSQKYLRTELDRTDVVELRQSVNRLLEAELKKEMLATVRVQYSFRVIDPAKPADEHDFVRPKRLFLGVFGLFAGTALGVLSALALNAIRRERRSREEALASPERWRRSTS